MDFQLDDYKLKCINQQNKGAGGESLLVDKHLEFIMLDEVTARIDKALEQMTVEIYKVQPVLL